MIGLRKRSSESGDEPVPSSFLLRKVAAVDLFTKPKEDYCRSQTRAGAIISIITVFAVGLLASWEVMSYTLGWNAYKTELSVDTSPEKNITFNIDITFMQEPCHDLFLDVSDVSGTFSINVTENLLKTPVDVGGNLAYLGTRRFFTDPRSPLYTRRNDPNSPDFCGRCFTGNKAIAGGKNCCNTCEEVMAEHDRKGLPRPNKNVVEQCIGELSLENPGCNYRGALNVRKVSGVIFFTPKVIKNTIKMEDLLKFDASHVINKFSIGDESVRRHSRRGVLNPLEKQRFNGSGRFMKVRYYLNIVPTTYGSGASSGLHPPTYEYSANWNSREVAIGYGGFPSVEFSFDFFPMQVNNNFKREPIYHFLVQLCGIVGGLFVVLGLVDSVVARLTRLV